MLKILKSGLLTTVQDSGRYGYQKYGVIVSGSMDPLALRIANLLAGNNEFEAALEITLLGPEIQFTVDTLISICGGDLSPRLNGKPIRLWRPIFVKHGSVLSFGPAISGSRAYIAVAGGVNIPSSLGSKSTYLRAKLGGYLGRTLQSGDQLNVSPPSFLASTLLKLLSRTSTHGFKEAGWAVSNKCYRQPKDSHIVRVMKGRQFDLFTPESQAAFFSEPFVITSQSDRMGYRLKGPALSLRHPQEIYSEAVCYGTIQVPPGGQPIVLLADRPATGGYPKMAEIASVDFPVIAQARPGEPISFRLTSIEEAQTLLVQREQMLRLLKQGIQQKYKDVKEDG
jgi:antagonist of KipI